VSGPRPLVAGNWKMHKTAAEAAQLVREVLEQLRVGDKVEVLLLPPFTDLAKVREVLGPNSTVLLGAQNCHWEPEGAFTGEISTAMLAGQCDYVLVGHSERRQLFGETDQMVRRKLVAVLEAGMLPLLAVGETQEEHDEGLLEAVLVRQASAALLGLRPEQVARCTIAYEPVWAIGTGRAASPADGARAAAILAQVVAEAAGRDEPQVRILYGGSVTPETAAALIGARGISGALVGGASLQASDFCRIVSAAGG
jgi:triosephosphate isomerase